MINYSQNIKQQIHTQTQQNIIEEDICFDRYGDLTLTQQQQQNTNRNWIKVCHIDQSTVGNNILLRARIHNSRIQGKIAFLILRENWYTIQAVSIKGDSASSQMLKFIGGIPLESIVDVEAVVAEPNFQIKYCTQKVELQIKTIRVISRSASKLPIQIEDASKKIVDFNQNLEYQYQNNQLSLNQRLNNRVLDLRTPAKQAIFRVSSGISLFFRQFLIEQGFIEIHTPKLQGYTTQNDNIKNFKLKYFNQDAILSQSSYLYKQMSLMGDFDRVFEISPVFQAIHGNTNRELCEYTCMDLEMVIKEHYTELLDLTEELALFILKEIEKRFQQESKIISQQFQFEPITISQPIIRLTFLEGLKLLQQSDIIKHPITYMTISELKQLGKLIKEKFGTDFFIMHRFPREYEPIYVMPCKDNPEFSLSYVLFLRGEAIASGNQKIHHPELLSQQIQKVGIDFEQKRGYINSFNYGAFPHGGCAFGLEKLLYLYFDLKNIRNSSLFPRDSSRLFP
ncbi:unnamed protein product [Paramecium sonneborni]|uniref:Aminoacyl-transfer RNA synthetases class-II family profile domain-containing protein n=1 Tax=Paramecium sonneborni TaxID=65129 RepID=A0A8S1MN95_9CILI|nr:unnamed protein product [Paramecium sonneborni]